MATIQEKFIAQIAPTAVKHMKEHKILASLTIAQACLESNYGRSGLAKAPNYNLFGIKAKAGEPFVTMKTTEYVNGKPIKVDANFRAYKSWDESLADHVGLFLRLSRYSNLIGERDAQRAAVLVQKDGYATDPAYSDKLWSVIHMYNLTQYDKEAETLSQVSSWAAVPWDYMKKEGIMDGSRPKDNITREEFATALYRAMAKVGMIK